MKKSIKTIVVLLFSVTIICGQSYSGGSGTSGDPYLIASKADLKYLSENSGTESSKFFKQTSDIAFAASDFLSGGDFYNGGAGFIPLGSSLEFSGGYNGNGHTISNLVINNSGAIYLGFFYAVAFGSVVTDLGLVNVDIQGGSSATGALAGSNRGTISNCYSTGSVTNPGTTYDYVGGLVGNNSHGAINNCYSSCTVSGQDVAGGLIGSTGSNGGTISNCFAIGSVNGTGNVGGFAGVNSNTISNSFWDKDIISTGIASGTTIGATGISTPNMKRAYTFTVVGWSSSIWYIGDGINNSYPYLYWQNPSGTSLSATLTPSGSGTSGDPYLIASIENLYWLSNNDTQWGAYYQQTADISFSASDFASDGGFYNGGNGFIPIGNNGISSNFTGTYDGNGHIISNVQINNASSNYIGFFGYTGTGTDIKNLGLENIDITGQNYVGGLVGYVNNPTTISSCYVTGSISGSDIVGGLVGYNTNGTISNCYSTCTVTGTINYAGGLVGINFITVSNCFSAGSVTGAANNGALLGANSGTSSNSFWDTDIMAIGIGSGSTSGATGKNTAEMKTLSTFTNTSASAGLSTAWDFVTNPYNDAANNDYWDMDTTNKTINSGYPFLSWQNNGAVLPVELTSFAAVISGNFVELKWKTETEVNNYGFEVERQLADLSAEAENSNQNSVNQFEKIGFVAGAGNSNSPKEYAFVDNSKLNGKYQYRLKQIDIDGNYKYSEIVSVEIHSGESLPEEFTLHQNYPNPFNPSTVIRYSILAVDAPSNAEGLQNVTLKIYDILGNEVTTLVNENQPAGNYKVTFNASGLASGVYLYKLQTSNGFVATKKLMLMK